MRLEMTKIYEFSELKKEVQEKVIENFRNDNEYELLQEVMNEYLTELLIKNKIEVVENLSIQYSLGYSQGDGAAFFGVFKWKDKMFYVKQYGNYSHYNSKNIEVTSLDGEEIKISELKILEKFNHEYVEICKELEKNGYAFIEDEDLEENIIGRINDMEYEFTEDGVIY